jgi:hypothetical protein
MLGSMQDPTSRRFACAFHGQKFDGERFRLVALNADDAVMEAVALAETYDDGDVAWGDIFPVDEGEWLSLKEVPPNTAARRDRIFRDASPPQTANPISVPVAPRVRFRASLQCQMAARTDKPANDD